MYKVFINNKRLILANNTEIIDYGDAAAICLKKPETVTAAIKNHLLKSTNLDLIILSPDYKKLIEVFESNYEVRLAAGGWVWNEIDELLMIFRENHWDIPKGHLDDGESIEECAIREVKEETGVSNLEIISRIGISRHIYEYQGRAVLKVTHWYKMKASSKEILKPQAEEGIEKVQWVAESYVKERLQSSWKSLFEFYEEHTIY